MNESIINFLEPKGNKYKTLEKVNLFLNMTLGNRYSYKWTFDNKIKPYYTTEIYEIYLNNFVLVYFPNDCIRIDMSRNNAKKIVPFKAILEGSYKEKAINFKYYNKKLNQVMDGPTIIVINLPLESLLLDNDNSILSLFEKSYL